MVTVAGFLACRPAEFKSKSSPKQPEYIDPKVLIYPVISLTMIRFIGQVSHKEEQKIFHSLHNPSDSPILVGETIGIQNINGVLLRCLSRIPVACPNT